MTDSSDRRRTPRPFDGLRCLRVLRSVPPHPFLTSNHRKNGPPIIAVTMPTGSSTGAMMRARHRSQSTRNAAPKRVDRRQHDAMIGADQQPHQVRHDDADEADRTGQRDRRAGGERGAQERDPLRARDVDAARGGDVVAEREQIERRGSSAKSANDSRMQRQGGDDRADSCSTSRSPISQRDRADTSPRSPPGTARTGSARRRTSSA